MLPPDYREATTCATCRNFPTKFYLHSICTKYHFTIEMNYVCAEWTPENAGEEYNESP